VGVPPLTGVGVNVTEVPAQIVEAVAPMLTAGVTTGFTVMVTGFEVAVGEVEQATVEVITADTMAPLFKVLEENVGPVAVFTPFNTH
jgi:hypothetical protein